MADERRSYLSSSIEELEAVYRAHANDVTLLSQLVQELSFRTTRRARHLLALAAGRLADLEPEPDGPASASDDVLLSEEGAPEYEGAEASVHADNVKDAAPTRLPSDNVDGEEPPDDRKRPDRLSRVRPVGTPGLPEPWVPPFACGPLLGAAADADLAQIYVAALAALIAEIKSTGVGQKRYELENGIRVEGKEAVYEFSFTDEADLFEDATVEVEVSGRRIAPRLFRLVQVGYFLQPMRIWAATFSVSFSWLMLRRFSRHSTAD